jgi:hypothetical protein
MGLAALLFGEGSALASGQDLFGFGARSAALGGSSALVEGYEAAYHNPAALGDLKRRSLALGLVAADPALEVDGALRPGEPPVATVAGVALPLRLLGWWEGRVGLALGLWAPTDVIVRGRIPSHGTPHLPVLEERARTIGAHLAVGFRPHERLSVGGGVLALAALVGRIRVRPAEGGRLTAAIDDELIADYAPILGAKLEPADHWTVGVAYRGESVAKFDVPLDIDLGDRVCIGDGLCVDAPLLGIRGTAQYDPRQAQVDLAWRQGGLRLSLGALWRQWSLYPLRSAPPVPGSPVHEPPGFDDTLSWRAAAEWRAVDRPGWALVTRAAGGWEPSPAPKETGTGALLDATRRTAAVGVGVALGDGGVGTVTFDAFAMHQGLVERTHSTTAGELTVSGRVLVGGAQVAVLF